MAERKPDFTSHTDAWRSAGRPAVIPGGGQSCTAPLWNSSEHDLSPVCPPSQTVADNVRGISYDYIFCGVLFNCLAFVFIPKMREGEWWGRERQRQRQRETDRQTEIEREREQVCKCVGV